MNSDQRTLWQRIQAHSLDDPQSASPFSLRLAEENGWKPGFTQRAIEEYRRFAFLATAAGHPVSPSDVVDQVWHLHLLYTRDYWGEFCPKTLGAPLHHGPARGGIAEKDKLTDWYGNTLASYRRFFGEPPADLWPARPMHPKTVRVEVARHWIIRKPRIRLPGLTRSFTRRGIAEAPPHALPAEALAERPALFSGATALLFAGQTQAEWPFNLRGPEFLLFYVFMVGALVALALWVRRSMQGPDQSSEWETLSPYEVAHLAGGPNRVFVAALAAVAQRGLVVVGDGGVVRTSVPCPDNLPLVERAICSAARETGTKLKEIREASESALDQIEDALFEKRLLLEGSQLTRARLLPAAVLAFAVAVGGQKIAVALSLGRPVTFLVILTILTAVGAVAFVGVPPRLNGRGRGALRQWEQTHATRKRLSAPEVQSPDGALWVPLAVGLFGATVLQGTELENVAKYGLPRGSDGGTGGCSSSCSTSSCGGGGGDGGGGCGGCGGD